MNLITATEAAAILRITPTRVRQLCEEKKIWARRIGGSGQWRIDLDRLLDQGSQENQDQNQDQGNETTFLADGELNVADVPDTSIFQKIKKAKF